VTETEGPEYNHRTPGDPGKSSFEDHPVLGSNKGFIQNYFADKILPMIINNLRPVASQARQVRAGMQE
jgi:hypothetical protein